MLRSPSDTARSATAVTEPVELAGPAGLAGLLRDLGPQIRLGGAVEEIETPLPTGLPDIDRLLGDGFPRGRLSEITGPASSGRTTLALALLASTTTAGEITAVVDGADAFDPGSAERAGVALDRVLWVRAPRAHNHTEALRCTERILAAHGFALVLLDLALPELRLPPAVGPRLARAAASTGTTLVALTRQRALGTAAVVALELSPATGHFTGTPALLEGLEIQAQLVRHRSAPGVRPARVRVRTRAA